VRATSHDPAQLTGQDWHEWTVPAQDDLLRLDSFLVRRLPGVSRRAVFALIKAGHVRLNRGPGKKGSRVRSGDRVRAQVRLSLRPSPSLPVRLVYAQGAVLGLDKPPGLPSVALRFGDTRTVANYLAAHYPETTLSSLSSRAPLEAGVVHRLDTPTSGLLLAARTAAAYTALRAQFSDRRIIKDYLAWVHGRPSGRELDGTRRFFLMPEGRRGQRMRVVMAERDLAPRQRAQEAMSTYTCLETRAGYSLIRVRLHTGVRHQIRAHLAALGYPLVGDTHYGAPAGASRLALHAEALRFVHPETGQSVRLFSPAGQDFRPKENGPR